MMSEAAGAPHRRQGRTAPGRTLSARRLHCDEPVATGRTGGGFLPSARRGGAVDQRRKERDQPDAATVPWLSGQCRSPPAAQAGLQPCQLPAHICAAGDGRATVACDAVREVGEDRRQGCAAPPLHRLPDGRGRRAEVAVPRDPAAHRRAATSTGPISEAAEILIRRWAVMGEPCPERADHAQPEGKTAAPAAQCAIEAAIEGRTYRIDRVCSGMLTFRKLEVRSSGKAGQMAGWSRFGSAA